MREILSKLRRTLASITLVAVVCQMSLLVLPGHALAATNTSGGTTDAIINGSGVGFTLTNLTLVSEIDNDIEDTSDIRIRISAVTPLAGSVVGFDTTAVPSASVTAGEGGLVLDSVPTVTVSDIVFNVTEPSISGDYVVISGIKVKATMGGVDQTNRRGNAHLRVTTGASLSDSYASTFEVDAQPPAIDSIVSDATAAGVLKIGDSINFTLHPRHLEPNATINGSYNSKPLDWTSSDGGINYNAQYTIMSGDPDQVLPLQIQGVIITDNAGNPSAALSGSDVVKTIDASAPGTPTINPVSSPVNANSQNITGTAAPGSLVKVTGGVLPKEQQLAGGVTDYSIEVPLTQDATNNLSVTATDGAVNVSNAAHATIVEDSTSPAVTMGTSPGGQEFDTNGTLVFAGTTEAGADVKLEIFSDTIVEFRTADGVGQWEFRVPASEVGTGSHSARITVTDAAGNSLVFEGINFGIKAVASATPPLVRSETVPVVLAQAAPTPSAAVQPSALTPTVKEDIADTAIKAAEDVIEDTGNTVWQTIITVIAIIIIALGVGTAGYYGYEWWATRDGGEAALKGAGWGEDAEIKKAVKKVVKKSARRKKSSRRGGSSGSAGSRW